ncbi:MAG: response regulator [Nitrospirae bacterium]|nr:response regulator [Nitrospirota bacterium]
MAEHEQKDGIDVLLVEDSLSQAVFLKNLLLRYRYKVRIARNGLEGLEFLKEEPYPDIIISDVQMPIMDGYEMCKQVKNDDILKNIPVILLTQLSAAEDIIKGLESGADNFIIKPYSEESLINRIEQLIKLYKTEQSSSDPKTGIELTMGGKNYVLNPERRQILNLLVTTYEKVIDQNKQLLEKEYELTRINSILEQRVEEETKKRLEHEQLLVHRSKMATMGEMLGVIAHQWKQPLNSFALLVQDLRDSFSAGQLNQNYIDINVEESMRQIGFMAKTIDDFRKFFMPSKKMTEFNVVEAINEVIRILSSQIKNSSIKITVESIGNSKLTVTGYRNEFMHVILNILSNSRDAILARGKSGERAISIVINTDGSSVVTEIQDTGGGIPEDILSKVFDAYFTTKEQSDGTGIGLYISKIIIESNMRGTISAENRGGGALFKISIPHS